MILSHFKDEFISTDEEAGEQVRFPPRPTEEKSHVTSKSGSQKRKRSPKFQRHVKSGSTEESTTICPTNRDTLPETHDETPRKRFKANDSTSESITVQRLNAKVDYLKDKIENLKQSIMQGNRWVEKDYRKLEKDFEKSDYSKGASLQERWRHDKYEEHHKSFEVDYWDSVKKPRRDRFDRFPGVANTPGEIVWDTINYGKTKQIPSACSKDSWEDHFVDEAPYRPPMEHLWPPQTQPRQANRFGSPARQSKVSCMQFSREVIGRSNPAIVYKTPDRVTDLKRSDYEIEIMASVRDILCESSGVPLDVSEIFSLLRGYPGTPPKTANELNKILYKEKRRGAILSKKMANGVFKWSLGKKLIKKLKGLNKPTFKSELIDLT